MISKINELFCTVEKEFHARNEVNLRNLQDQISPHFLYNTLTSIRCHAALAGSEHDEIVAMTDMLITLLRKSLSHNNDLVCVLEELELAETYLRIMHIRYKDRLNYSIKTDKNVLSCLMPKLILQPIIENCILHGLNDNPVNIEIVIHRFDNIMEIVVADDGQGMEPSAIDSLNQKLNSSSNDALPHIGLRNVSERIRLYFGAGASIRVSSRPHGGILISIILPVREKGENE